jgi:hypothetical protein
MSFETEMQQWGNNLTRDAFNGVKMIADELFVDLCENSPTPGDAPFSLGSYVLSHRIAGGNADTSITEITDENPSAVMVAMNNEIPKLDTIQPFQDIVISNSIYYNENIESIGWTNTGPYHTFHSTEGPMEMKAQQQMDRI